MDARSITDIVDEPYQDYRIHSVAQTGDVWGGHPTGYELGIHELGESERSGSLVWLNNKYGYKPASGQTLRLYGDGFGWPIRGMALDGSVIWYQTKEEHHADFLRRQEEARQEKWREYEAKAEERCQAYTLLPSVFTAFLEKCRRNNPHFWEIEGYELFICQEALLIVDTLGSPEEIATFSKLSYDEQCAFVPNLSDAHSGNTFGKACQMAFVYLRNPDDILNQHAGMSAILGCEGAGCHTKEDFPDAN